MLNEEPNETLSCVGDEQRDVHSIQPVNRIASIWALVVVVDPPWITASIQIGFVHDETYVEHNDQAHDSLKELTEDNLGDIYPPGHRWFVRSESYLNP